MKVIFRSNDNFAKKTLGQLGGAEEWLTSLNKFLGEDAIARLSLFVETDEISLATLDIVDANLHVHSSVKNSNKLTAIESVIAKCLVQLKKAKSKVTSNETIRYNDEYNISFDSLHDDFEIEPSVMESFELLNLVEKLDNEKTTPKYNRIMNKYISYLYRAKDIERAEEHLRILYSILDNADLEEVTVADYERLNQSIFQIEKERNSMMKKQDHFETNTRDAVYINQMIESEAKLAKLKK